MDSTEIKLENGQKGNRIVLSDLTKKQKELILTGGVIAAGAGIGAGIFSFYSMNDSDQTLQDQSGQTFDQSEELQNEEITLYTDKPVASILEGENSFAEAFKVARNEVGAGGWFIFNDKVYNTYYKEEWESLSVDERQDYLASIKPEQSPIDDNIESEPDLASVEILADDETSEESNPESELNSVTDSEIENVETVANEDTVELDSSPEISVDYITEISDQGDDEITESQIEVDLPEDNRIFEVSIEDQNEFDLVSIDASDVITFGDDTLEVMESITPIAIHNLEDTLDFGLEADLLTNAAKDLQEYPWGEEVDPVTDQTTDTFTDHTIEINVEPVIEADLKSEEIEEYPWGEPVVAPVVENNPDVSTIMEAEQPVQTIEELHPDNIEEYPWGEPVIDPASDHADMSTPNLTEAIENPVIIDAELSQDEIEEYPWGEPVNENEDVSMADNIKTIEEEELISTQVQEIHPTIDAAEEYPWGEPIENLTNQPTEEASNLFDQDDLHDLNNPFLDSDPNF